MPWRRAWATSSFPAPTTNWRPLLVQEYVGADLIYANTDVYNFEGKAMDPDLTDLGLERVRQIAAERQALLLAGMDAVFLELAPLPDVINRVKEIMLVCKNGPSPMMFLFNGFNPRTSIERIFTAMHAARIYGAPDATAETSFEMPEYMTFEQFLKHTMVHNPEGYTFERLKQSGYSHLR